MTQDDRRDDRPHPNQYSTLPERVRPEDMVEEQPTEPPHDPDGGRDPERDFMIRWAGGG